MCVEFVNNLRILCRKHQQQMERGDFSACLSPTALETAEPFDHIPFGELKNKHFFN